MAQGKLVEGPIKGHIVSMTVPMIWGIFAFIFFNVADTYFVGQLGKVQLEAMTFTFPVVMVYFSLGIGLSIGASSIVAQAVGKGDPELVRRLCTDSLTLSALIVVVFIAGGILTIDPMFRLLGADDRTIPLIKDYMLIWYIGLPFLVLPMVGNAAIRALGDASTPSRIMIISAVMNIVIDPILIFGLIGFPRMELKGAAIATVIARVFTLVAALYVLIVRENMVSFRPVTLPELLKSWRSILQIAIPSCATNIITPIGLSLVTAMLARHGAEAVAAFGIASRVESLVIVPVLAMSSIIGPFVGQNLGAEKYDRIRKSVNLSMTYNFFWSIGVTVVLYLLARPIAQVFTQDLQTIELTVFYLSIVPISFGLLGVSFIVNATFNAVGHPLKSTFLSFLRMFLFFVPPAYLLSIYYGEKGVISAAILSNIGVGVFALLFFRQYVAKLQRLGDSSGIVGLSKS